MKIFARKKKEAKPPKWYDSWAFIIVVCIILPLTFRSLVYAPFHIPSGSMYPTLLIGDYIFVSKSAYGYGNVSFPFSPDVIDGRVMMDEGPKRGDIVVFRPPPQHGLDYIKRVIGLPGDRIQVKGSRLYINDERVPRERIEDFVLRKDGSLFRIPQYVETLPNSVSYRTLDMNPAGRLDNTEVFTVPEGNYFMMGDNRDGSVDSRVQDRVGFIPASHLVGRADRIFISTKTPLWQLWNWLTQMRTERFNITPQEANDPAVTNETEEF